MSRKKSKRSASLTPETTPEAVPAEILADGSGPVAAAAEPSAVAAAAEPSADMDPGVEIAARAAELDELEDIDEALAADADADLELGADAELAESSDELAADGVTAEAEAAVEGALMPATMDAAQLKHLVEALVFATDKPITLQRLRQLTRISDVRRLEAALAELTEDYRDRGIALHCVSGGYQFRTNTTYSPWVQQLIAGRPVRLSRAQLETLAIVAYRQPITRPEIDEIRGVDSSATLRLLLDRALIRVLGKREEVGRPLLYGTTKEFLDFFSLSDLRELPTLREYSELTAESRQVMSDRLGVPLEGEGEPGAEGMTAEASSESIATDDGSVAVFDPAGRSANEIPDDAQFEVASEMSNELADAEQLEASDDPAHGYDEREASEDLAASDDDGIAADAALATTDDVVDDTSAEPTE